MDGSSTRASPRPTRATAESPDDAHPPRHLAVLAVRRADPGHRPGPARSVADRRAALRAGRAAHGRKRQLAVPAARQRAVFRTNRRCSCGCRRRSRAHRQSAHRLCCLAAGAGHVVVRARPRPQAVDARIGVYAGWLVLLAIQFTWQAKKAQIDPLVVFWITWPTTGCCGMCCAGRTGCGRWAGPPRAWARSAKGVRRDRPADAAGGVRVPARLARVRVHARDPRFWLGPLAFVAACGVWLVPMLVAALGQGGHGIPRLRRRHPAAADGHPLCQCSTHGQPAWYFLEVALTAWLPTVLALPWALPMSAAACAAAMRGTCCRRWPGWCWCCCSSHSLGQARHVHPAGPADAGAGDRTAAAGPAAPGRRAARLLLGFVLVFAGRARCRVGDAGRRARLRRRFMPRSREPLVAQRGGNDAGGGGRMRAQWRVVVQGAAALSR